MNKKMKLTLVGLVAALTLSLTGCNAKDSLASVVEKTYSVAVQGQVVVDVITEKLEGSQVWVDIEDYVKGLDEALATVQDTLEKAAPWVGLDLSTPTTVALTSSVSELDKLNAATAELRQAIESE